MTAMVSFAAQTCAMPPRMNKNVCEGIGLHSDHDLNDSYELFGLVLIPIKQFRIGGLGTLGWVLKGLDRYTGLGVHCDSLCHCGRHS